MDWNDILTLIVSCCAFLLALASFIYTVRSNRANRRADDLQKVRLVAVSNTARFNGLMNALASEPTPSPSALIEPTRLYAEVRDAYKIYRHSFNEADRAELDAILDQVEKDFDPDDLASSLTTALPLFPTFLSALESKLKN